jgi:hypothetical protein
MPTLDDLYRTVICPLCEAGVGRPCTALQPRVTVPTNYTQMIHAARKELAILTNDQLRMIFAEDKK